MARRALVSSIIVVLTSFIIMHAYGENSLPRFSSGHYHDQMQKMEAYKASLLRRDLISISPSSMFPSPSFASSPSPSQSTQVGKTNITEPLLGAISDAFDGPSNGFLMEGIVNLGGSQVNLEGGTYIVSRPLRFPVASRGNSWSRMASGDEKAVKPN
ncbi:unnamed protein product [Ilex paraguariensis]|uniref:Dirigent protein n=1 Tax=Ilex paraguariensis TaxID=185542 RepID=A0ABC8TUV9_9AQUA